MGPSTGEGVLGVTASSADWVWASAVCRTALPTFGPALAAAPAMAAPTATPVLAPPAAVPAPLVPAVDAALPDAPVLEPPAAPVPPPDDTGPGPPPLDAAVGAGLPRAGIPPPPSPLGPRIFFAPSVMGELGTGMGRLRADFASCSLDIAWYMSNPTKLRNL